MKDSVIRLACEFRLDALARLWHRNRLLILVYHGVVAQSIAPRCNYQLPVADFRRQMAWIQRHFEPLALPDALARLASGKLPPRACVITFDDGYSNVATVAAPVLEEAGIPASVFVVTDHIGRQDLLWPDRIWWTLARCPEGPVDLSSLGLGVVHVGDALSREPVIDAALGALKRLPRTKKNEIVDAVVDAVGGPRDLRESPFSLLEWEDMRRLAATGLFTFGAHSRSHEILSQCEDDEVRRQVVGSIEEVNRKLGVSSAVFAYPNGQLSDFDERAKSAVRDAGCDWALSGDLRLASARDDPLALPRVNVSTDLDFGRFRLLCSGVRPPWRQTQELPV